MKKYKLLLAAPPRLDALRVDIEKINHLYDEAAYVQITAHCTDIKELEVWAGSEIDTDFLLLFDLCEARANQLKARNEMLEVLKTIRLGKRCKIVAVFSKQHEMESEWIGFVNELMKLDIQNFYFADEVSMDDIARWLERTRTLPDNEKYLRASVADTKERTVSQRELAITDTDQTVGVSDEREMICSQDVPIQQKQLKSQKRIVERATPEMPLRMTTVIGLVGSGVGVGVTTLCQELAETLLKKKNQKVAIVERNSSGHLAHADLSGATYYSETLAQVPMRNFDVILLDYGAPYQIASNGEYLAEPVNQSEELQRLLEWQLCSHIILVSSPQRWRQYQAKFFIQDPAFAEQTQDWVFYFPGGKEDQKLKEFRGQFKSHRCIVDDYQELLKEIGM